MSTNEVPNVSTDNHSKSDQKHIEEDEELSSLLDSEFRFKRQTSSGFSPHFSVQLWSVISFLDTDVHYLPLSGALSDFEKSSVKPNDANEPDVAAPVASGSASKSVPVTQLNDNVNGEPNIDSFDDNLSQNFAKFDEMFTPLINADPELKEHWSKLTQSCAEAGLSLPQFISC